MSVSLLAGLLLCVAYLCLAFVLYRATPRLSELEERDRRAGAETRFKEGRSSEPIKPYPLYTGPEVRAAFRQTFSVVLDGSVLRTCASWLVGAFLVVVTPIRHALFFARKTHLSKRSAVPLAIFNRLSTHVFGSVSQLINPVAILEDDARNGTLETRAASLIAGMFAFWRNLKSGNLVNLTRGLRSDTDEAFFLFTRCSGLHELSRGRPRLMAESTDVEPGSHVVVLIRGVAYRVDLPERVLTDEDQRQLLGDIVAIVRHAQHGGTVTEERLSLCTHVYDERQVALRSRHRDYFDTINRALFVVSLIPEASPESINELATEHFAHPESCWHDKGLQFIVYGNGKASVIARLRNYVFGSTILKATSYAGLEARRHDFSALLRNSSEDAASVKPLQHAVLDEREREVLRSYREQHRAWVRKAPHIGHARVGRRSFRELAGDNVSADSIFQVCLHAAYARVFGRFPVSSEAVYMGCFRGLYGGAMELCGTQEMKDVVARLTALEPGDEVPRALLAGDADLVRLLRRAVDSHRQHMLFPRQGFVTPTVLLAWFRAFAFTPLLLGAVLWACWAPKPLKESAILRWLASGLSRLPLLSRLLAFEVVDIASSHLPAVPGVRAAAIQNCRFDQMPRFFTPELFLPEKVAGVYRPRFLVHYSIQDEQVHYSPLCFSPEVVNRREQFIQAVDFYLRVCACMCEMGSMHVGNSGAPVKMIATG
ncbi:choline/carnitine O-acyltransferase [Hyalangium gracile]|uniref:choline/carnitine O-acyltransferase n=1 Tax=Hyalangium gracile TaxID=394092 RepID=UPI001CCF1B11|nr:choline/carnitine O-acyltransferase [Hyalangium gracile]